MNRKIIVDSSASLQSMDGIDFAFAPLTIRTDEREFVDNEELIISSLSGSYNAAMTAKTQYEDTYPDRKVFIFDSVSAGPEIRLLAEKVRELINHDLDFDTVCEELKKYKEERSSLVFSLESLKNLANNGRVSHAVAAICSIAGIRVVGDVQDGLHPTDKCRGEKKAISTLVKNMKAKGYAGGKVIIDHCFNLTAAETLKSALHADFQEANIRIFETKGLCSFYAEKGGLMIGFERN